MYDVAYKLNAADTLMDVPQNNCCRLLKMFINVKKKSSAFRLPTCGFVSEHPAKHSFLCAALIGVFPKITLPNEGTPFSMV
jgi:hypothetical protein